MQVKNLDRSSVLRLWKTGTPLSDAPGKFSRRQRNISPEPDQSEAADISPKSGLGMSVRSLDEPETAALIKAGNAVAKFFGNLSDRLGLQLKLQADLFGKLDQGVLIAIGYNAGKSNQHWPELISPQFFEERFFNWSRNEISDGEHKFVRVRIARLPTSIGKSPANKPNLPGRPSDRPVILEAIKILKKKNPELANLGRKTQREMVKSFLVSERRTHKVPADRTIEKYLREALEISSKR